VGHQSPGVLDEIPQDGKGPGCQKNPLLGRTITTPETLVDRVEPKRWELSHRRRVTRLIGSSSQWTNSTRAEGSHVLRVRAAAMPSELYSHSLEPDLIRSERDLTSRLESELGQSRQQRGRLDPQQPGGAVLAIDLSAGPAKRGHDVLALLLPHRGFGQNLTRRRSNRNGAAAS